MRSDRLVSVVPALLLLAPGALSAQTSKALLSAGAEQQYLTFKRTFQKMVDNGKLAVPIARDSGAVDLMDCTAGHTFLKSEAAGDSGRTRQLADLAYEVVRLKKLMTKLGYPESVWRPALLAIEEEGKREFDPTEGAHLKGLSEALNSYRQRSTLSLPETFVEGACGE